MIHAHDPSDFVEEALIQLVLAQPTVNIPQEYEKPLLYNIPWCLCSEADVCHCAENMHRKLYGQFNCDADDLRKCKRYFGRMLFHTGNNGTTN